MESQDKTTEDTRFGAALTEAEVRRFQAILRNQCGLDIGLPEVRIPAIVNAHSARS
jgi:hypothetical protein